MKIKKILVASMIAGAALIGSSAAYAADVGNTYTIDLEANGTGGFNSVFGNTFTSADVNKTFTDKYDFVLSTDFDSSSSITSTYLKSSTVQDLVITNYSLVKYDPVTSSVITTYAGTNLLGNGAGTLDLWSLTASGLSAGNYYIEVGGLVKGNGGGSYASNLTIAVAPVPEPETYAMMVAGLGLLGVVARRKKAAKQA